VTVDRGISGVYLQDVSGTVASADLTLASLSRNPANAPMFLLNGNTPTLGTAGNSGRLKITAAPALTNNIMGPWAIVGGTEFASYNPSFGVGALNQVGYAGYDALSLPASSQPTWNVRTLLNETVPAGGTTVGTYNMAGNINLSFDAAGDTLNLAAGGLLKSGNTANVLGSFGAEGQLTAGGAAPSGPQDLFIYNNQNFFTINSKIIDNPAGGGTAVRLVAGSANGGTISLTNANTYTGGTVFNGQQTGNAGTLELFGDFGTVVIPAGGITLNYANLTMVGNEGQIDPSNTITLNGSGTVTLVGPNTLAGLVFNNIGGADTPTVNTDEELTLPGGASIQVTSSNVTTTATINGILDYTGAASAPTIQVDPITVNGQTLNIPSAQVKPNDVIAVREKAKKQTRVQDSLSLAEQSGFPQWVSVDKTKMEGVFKSVPERSDVAADINESLIVELYSR